MRRFLSTTLALTLTLFLAACESAEERAERHYSNALALLEEGDPDRAIVELRNVFQQVPNHLDARHLLAATLLNEKENIGGAYRQYLRLSEQYPDDLIARIELAEIAFFAANWDEFVRHGTKAREIAPEDERVKILATALDYRAAVQEENTDAMADVVEVARTLMDPSSPSRLLRELVLDDAVRRQELTQALTLLDGLTNDFPDEERLWRQKLQILITLGNQDAIEALLIDLVERFPEDAEQKQILVRYYLSRGDLDRTEDFLRNLVAKAPEEDRTPRVDLIRFLTELRSVDEARIEIEDAIATETNPTPFIIIGATLDFEVGETEKAISAIEAAIANSELSEDTDDTNALYLTLARMLQASGNDVDARALVEAVLIEDSSNVGALKMSASWLIEADDTNGAISALRVALDNDSKDPEVLSLMASAYIRAGSADLARDFLALAVEASGNAPAETLRYVQVLISEERFLPAEDVLLPALGIAPNDLSLLGAAGQLYLAMEDLGRTQQVVDTLRRLETFEATQAANQLEAARLNLAEGPQGAMQFLERLASGEDADVSSRILLLRARISTGDMERAIAIAQNLVDENPDLPGMQQVLAITFTAADEFDSALEIYVALAEQFPQEPNIKIAIAEIQTRQGNQDAARATVAAALQDNPTDLRLMWATASYLEADGDIDGAIGIYEQMYDIDSGNIVVANNLASLLGTYRDDEESLDRAWNIARRFRDNDLHEIQDTYGWLTHRRGDSAEALSNLQAAAAGLADDPIVQFHLAEALFALNEAEDALAQYRLVLDKAGVGDTRPMIETTRTRVAELEAAALAPQDSQSE